MTSRAYEGRLSQAEADQPDLAGPASTPVPAEDMPLNRDPAAAADVTQPPEIAAEPAPVPAAEPTGGHARILSALQADIAGGHHLMCVRGAAGSGKSRLLAELRASLTHGLCIMVSDPAPGGLLRNILSALKLGGTDNSIVAARRRLAIRLAMAEQHERPIVIIVDAVHKLLTTDMDLLLHFFPPGYASIVIAGAGEPRAWFAGTSAQDDTLSSVRIYSLDAPSAVEPRVVMPSVRNLSASSNRAAAAPAVSMPPPAPSAAPPSEPPSPTPAPVRAQPTVVPVETPLARQQRALESALVTASTAANALSAAQSQLRDRWRLKRSLRRWRTATFVVSLLLIAVLAIDVLQPEPAGEVAAELPAPKVQTPPVLATQVPDAAERALEQRAAATSESWRAPATSVYTMPPAVSVTEPAPPPEAATPGTSADSEHDTAENTQAQARAEQQAAEQEQQAGSEPAELPPSAAVNALPAPQRESAGRIYADRAEYEWRQGRIGDAMRSIDRGLASDPGNPRLLELQSILRGESGRP